MSRLQHIQVTVQQMAEAISSVLGMDVTVVDEAMVRIAGTGEHKSTIGRKIMGNSVYQTAIQNMEECVITDISTNNACGACEKRATCLELAQLCCPIIIGREAIGVIGLIAFSPKQQNEIANRGEHLLIFIRKMAELVAAKVVEKEGLNRLVFLKNQVETVLNFITEGILAIDDNACIININYAAEKMLRVKTADVVGFHISEIFPGTPIPEVLISGVGFVDREVSIWHNGRHHHYFINAKPMLVDGMVQGVVASFRMIDPQSHKQIANVPRITFDDIVGHSSVLELIKGEAQKAANTGSTVLLTGESGTGKEVFARAIHFESSRCDRPFITVNCAAIPETLLESELFGYEEGSFTGAKKGGKPGKFQLADKGTLFLDEIGDMPLSLQSKILRVLQDKTVERVGSIRVSPVDVRIIAATNRDLEAMVKQGQFREDLFYRLNVFPIMLPPLRERKEDIADLAAFFLSKQAKAYGKTVNGLSSVVLGMLLKYNWPGNIRELENAIECAAIKSMGGIIEATDLPTRIGSCSPGSASVALEGDKEEVRNAIALFGSNVEGKKRAAASLGISIATLYRKIKKYKIE